MTLPAGRTASARDRLLTMLAERADQYRPEQPVTLSSGALSDDYLDARVVTWDPEAKPLIGALIFTAIAGRADAAGGLTLGADPIAGAVPCSALFARAELQRRLEESRTPVR